MIGSYDTKVVKSGNVIEVYQYENDVLYGYQDTRKASKGRQKKASAEDAELNRKKVVGRAERDLRRIINTNFVSGSSRFITLTFKDNVTCIKTANYEFKKFVQRWKYDLGHDLKYSVVIEFQKRGAVHYHCMFYNLPNRLNLPALRKLWGHGSVNVKRVIDSVDNVGAYVVKYMSKSADDPRLMGKKCYFNSRNLKKPTEYKKDHEIERGLEFVRGRSPKYSKVFTNEYNSVSYSQYVITNE